MTARYYALLLLLFVAACDAPVINPTTAATSLSLQVVLGADAASLALDQGRIHIEGRTTKPPLTVAPGSTQTIIGLLPGTYTVALEGLTSGEVVSFGERTGIQVTAGVNTPVTVTLQSFVPTLQQLPATVEVGGSLDVRFNPVSGATGYTVEVADNPDFSSAQTHATANPNLSVQMSSAGTYHVRVRAQNRFESTGSTGQPSPPATVTVEQSASVCSAQSEIPQLECEALVALYESTDGPNWSVNTGWLANTSPCTWHGVGCPGGSFVTLDLASNQLTGSIPPALGNLSSLEYLRLFDNRLTGSIPPELENLSLLQYLELSNNQLSGSVPPELGNLPHLQSLYISQNQLTGNIPTELGNLSSLEFLYLDENQLTGIIPPPLGGLSNLQDLSLRANQLTGTIPPDLGSLSNLLSLSLTNNQLTGSIPTEFGTLLQLRSLSIRRNQLTGSIPPQLGSLSNLEFMHLDRNQLTGSIPPELGNLSNLVDLVLYSNQLAGGIPTELGNLSNLVWLHLRSNQLTGSVPPELGNLSSLQYWILSDNLLTGNIPPELGNLPSLLSLSLRTNQLSGSIPPELGNLPSLQFLYLHNNQLTGSIPTELGNLSTLEYLYLFGNHFTGTIPSELGNLSNLERLYLYQNQLSDLVPLEVAENGGRIQNDYGANQCTFFPPGNESLFMYDNPDFRAADLDGDGNICGVRLVPDLCLAQSEIPVSECGALGALYESTNGPNWTNNTNWLANTMPCSWYGVGCSGGSVVNLDLNSNQLTGTIPPELGNLPNLQEVRIASNLLTGSIPPELGNLSNLELLRLYSNQLSGRIPPELGNLSSLQFLDLYDNQMSESIPPELGSLSNLLGLSLHGNLLTGSIPPELGNLSSLETLSLHGNQLTGSIPPELGNLSSLRTLPLWDNQLAGSIPPELGNLSLLHHLNLHSNQLTGDIPPELGNLPSLVTLHLYDNQLTGSIPPELGNLANLEALRLNSNVLIGSIPAGLGTLTNLREWDLLHNQLSDLVPLAVAQNGGRIQAVYGAGECRFTPPGNESLFMYDNPDYNAADLDGDGSICGVGLTQVPPVSPGSWTPVGNMSVDRSYAAGVLLEDGRVLVVGGSSGSASQSAELFNPSTNSFISAGSIRGVRSWGHTVTRLLDGTVLIVGGINEPRTAELYDPDTGVFTSIGGPEADRQFHAATLLADGRVLLAGGHSSTQNGAVGHASVEIYDPDTRTFSPTTSMSIDRFGAGIVLLDDGRVAILGGSRTTSPGFSTGLRSVDIYDPVSASITSGTDLSTNHSIGMGVFRHPSGEVFVVGGHFTPASEWLSPDVTMSRPAPNMATPHGNTTPVMLPNGRILVAGGTIAVGPPVTTDAAELYVPTLDDWFGVASMNEARWEAVVVSLLDGRVLVAGGRTAAATQTSTAEVFDPSGS